MKPSFPDAFVLKLLKQDASLINAFRRLVAEQQLRNAHGIHLEPIKANPPYQSIRLDKGPRAKVLVDGDTLVFLDIEADHDKAYGKP